MRGQCIQAANADVNYIYIYMYSTNRTVYDMKEAWYTILGKKLARELSGAPDTALFM